MPLDLVLAINHANRVSDWQENLGNEEMPPSWMWPYEDELESWFEEVERTRKERYGGGGGGGDDVPMVANELVDRGRRK